MTEGEGPKEGAERRGCHHPVGKNALGRSGPEHVGMVDVTGTCHHGVHQGEDLATGQRTTDPSGEVDRAIDQAFETEPHHQSGHQDQPGIGHQIRLVEGHLDPVDSARY
jgi:hypothetical protein